MNSITKSVTVFLTSSLFVCPLLNAADSPQRGEPNRNGGVSASAAASAVPNNVSALLARGISPAGICFVPQCDDVRLPFDLVKNGKWFVFARCADAAALKAMRAEAAKEEVFAKRLTLESVSGTGFPFLDNYVDWIWVNHLTDATLLSQPAAEYFRILAPGGKALFFRPAGQASPTAASVGNWLKDIPKTSVQVAEEKDGLWVTLTKPPMAGTDNWSHWYHGPDNNTVSTDQVLKAPYLLQWASMPAFGADPVVFLAAGGRVFHIFGPVQQQKEPFPIDVTNSIVVRNGYNGTILWTRKLDPGYRVHRSAFVAENDAFYMIDGNACLVLDPQTGKEIGKIQIAGLGEEVKWIALEGGVLYMLAGPKDPPLVIPTGQLRWDTREDCQPDFVKRELPYGFGRSIGAYDLKSKKTLWTHPETSDIDSRAMGISGNRLFYYAPQTAVTCLDRMTGKPIWTQTDKEVLETIDSNGDAFSQEKAKLPRTLSSMLCTPEWLVLTIPGRNNYAILSASDGKMTSKIPGRKLDNLGSVSFMYVNGKLLLSNEFIDPATGKMTERIKLGSTGAPSCGRMSASPDGIFKYSRVYDLTKNETSEGTRSYRGNCRMGTIVGNGRMYVPQYGNCACPTYLLNGLMSFGPAGSFDFTAAATDKDRLESAPNADKVQPMPCDALDWPLYRGDKSRSCSTKVELPKSMSKIWEFTPDEKGHPTPPTAVGDFVFYGNDLGKVYCVNALSGQLVWKRELDGAVTLPPQIMNGRAYVGSSEGRLYALEAATGRLLWRFQAAPADRRFLLYDKFTSPWPVTRGVLPADGVVYVIAGLICENGTYVYALDAATGKIKWENNTCGHLDGPNQGVAGQGGLTICKEMLFTAGGGVTGATAFDLKTGRCLSQKASFYQAQSPGNEVGNFKDRFVLTGGYRQYEPGYPSTRTVAQEIETVDKPEHDQFSFEHPNSIMPVFDDELVVVTPPTYVYGMTCFKNEDFIQLMPPPPVERKDKRDPKREFVGATRGFGGASFPVPTLWSKKTSYPFTLVLAKNALLAAGDGSKNLKALDRATGAVLWETPLPGAPIRDGMLVNRKGAVFVVLSDGRLVGCAGENSQLPVTGRSQKVGNQ